MGVAPRSANCRQFMGSGHFAQMRGLVFSHRGTITCDGYGKREELFSRRAGGPGEGPRGAGAGGLGATCPQRSADFGTRGRVNCRMRRRPAHPDAYGISPASWQRGDALGSPVQQAPNESPRENRWQRLDARAHPGPGPSGEAPRPTSRGTRATPTNGLVPPTPAFGASALQPLSSSACPFGHRPESSDGCRNAVPSELDLPNQTRNLLQVVDPILSIGTQQQ